MRRAAPSIAVALALASCATPEIRLAQRFRAGEVRSYRLTATAETLARAGEASSSERSTLVASSRVEVLRAAPDGATLRLTITPRALRRDGRALEPPAPQEAEVVVSRDGSVRAVTRVGGLPADIAGGDVEDLAPLLGSALPTGRVRLGQRWEREVAGPGGRRGEQRGRVAALRVVRGYRCAVVALETRRPLVRERSEGGAPLRLEGEETSVAEVAFAFREGLPVRIASSGEGRFEVSSGPVRGGTVTIITRTTLELVSRSR